MARTIEDIMASSIEKAVAKATAPLIKKLDDMEKAIDDMATMMKAAESLGDERLITQKEAKRRLLINDARLHALVASGDISVVSTPNGRTKVLESSVNRYIGRLQTKVG